MLEADDAIFLTEKLIAFAVILQTLELLLIRHTFSDQGTWRWDDLSSDFKIFSVPAQKFIALFLPYRNFIIILTIRLAAGVYLLIDSSPLAILSLLVTSIMACLRWRGAFNGGSDYVTLMVLGALSISSLFPDSEKVKLGAILYIGIQITSSYFIAGVIKIRRKHWRDGSALKAFFSSTIFRPDCLTDFLLNNPATCLISSWTILLFEASFILAFLNPTICMAYIPVALAFHIGNFYIFGLNRFVFAWAACYPALYFSSQFIWSIISQG